jgi:hypothetical protein
MPLLGLKSTPKRPELSEKQVLALQFGAVPLKWSINL